MNRSESIGELAAALAAAQAAMKPAEMNAVNPFLHNSYADLGSVIEAARTAMTTNGLSFAQAPQISTEGITLETLIMHKSGEWLSSAMTLPVDDKKGLSSAQAAGSVITYLRRYALSSMLGIYADKDDDGKDSGKNSAAEQSVKPVATPAPAGAAKPDAPTQAAPTQAAPENGNGPTCPKCGGSMWDNREGKKNPKAPDYKCKDKACDGAIWPPKIPAGADVTSALNMDAPATPAQIQRMGILVSKLYPNGETETVFRPWLAENYNGKTSRTQLTIAEAKQVIASLEVAETRAAVA